MSPELKFKNIKLEGEGERIRLVTITTSPNVLAKFDTKFDFI